MTLKQVDIHHLRNITTSRLILKPGFNFIIGANGSGKTSFLEAFFLLGTGHSFRTRETSPLIQHEKESLTVFARTAADETVSIRKSQTGATIVQINQQPCRSSSELAHFLPCQIFYQDIFNIIDAGPAVRRSLLDWGLFHVKHEYLNLWKDYRRVLKHRNALLRQNTLQKQFIPWDKQLVSLSLQIDELRASYFERWQEEFNRLLQRLSDVSCEIVYFKGWDKKNLGKSLQEILHAQFESDKQRQYTQSGIHQADIFFESSLPGKTKQVLSRGQQKIILITLKLAQANLINKTCLYLFDDLLSELDAQHLQRLAACLKTIKGQFIVTSIDNQILKYFSDCSEEDVLSVNKGVIAPVSRET